MQNRTVNDLAKACGGTLLCGDGSRKVENISLDSRTMQGNDLFVPIIGEKVDAHRFIVQALENGAAAVLTAEHGPGRQPVPADGQGRIGYGKAWIAVSDTRKALQAIGGDYRRGLSIPLVGITGSVGKTTTKEMVAAALSGGRRVFKTFGSRNSQVGVPVTLTEIRDSDQIGVIELGMSEPGELAVIARIAAVDTALITNIGVAHIEQLGSRENIFREKMTIQEGMRPGGALLLNGDDPLLRNARAKEGCRTLYYGTGENCQYRAVNIRTKNGFPAFTVVCGAVEEPGEADGGDRSCPRTVDVRLRVMGAHQILNATAAIAVADLYGVPLEDAAAALEGYEGMKGRQQIRRIGGVTVIDDTYNANPVSMRGALDILASVEGCTRRIAVLADMKELGEESAAFHRQIGQYAAESGVDVLVTFGDLALHIREGAEAVQEKREAPLLLRHFPESGKEQMQQWITQMLRPGDGILLKGSNSMKLGETAEYVCQHYR